MRTLLSRLVRQGFLRREGGTFLRTDKPIDEDIGTRRQAVVERQAWLAQGLCEAAVTAGVEIGTTEDALALILGFFEQYHVALVLEEGGEISAGGGVAGEPESSLTTAVTARFLRDSILAGGDERDAVEEMLEGFILQNALLLKDISTAARRFDNLHVFFDSGVLFGALGFRGSATETATKELLSLLRETGAVLDVFEPTIREMRRVLSVYEDRIGTEEGRLSLYPTDLTRYFLTNHYSPSDIRMHSALVERNLRNLGVNVRDLPARKPRLTLNEADLSSRLAERPGGENVPRVVHDVDCVAGVITFRGGGAADALDHAKAVFVTTSGLTVRHTLSWYSDEGGRGFPPIIHYLVLSNLAWLKRPASAVKLKLHELVALCAAALRPSRAAWEAFIGHLRRLQNSGELSSDEVTAIVASELADRVLLEADIDDDSDASTLSEVVDRVKADYRAEASLEVASAKAAAEVSEAEALRIRNHLEGRARLIAKISCWALAGVVALALFAATATTIVIAVKGESPGALWVVITVILAAAGLASLYWGIHLNGARQWLEERVARRLKGWMGGMD